MIRTGIVLVLSIMLVTTPVAGVSASLMEQVYERPSKETKEVKVVRAQAEDSEIDIISDLLRYTPSENEISLMKRIAMAESGNTESIIGIERVMEVIINRVNSPKFPNTITGVAYQKNQFQTVTEGTIWKHNVNSKVKKAYNNIIKRGDCVDNRVLFFTAGGYNPYCVPAYKLGNHYFGY